jgi:hypothetical protein
MVCVVTLIGVKSAGSEQDRAESTFLALRFHVMPAALPSATWQALSDQAHGLRPIDWP